MNVTACSFSYGKGKKYLEINRKREEGWKNHQGKFRNKAAREWGGLFPISESQLSWNPSGSRVWQTCTGGSQPGLLVFTNDINKCYYCQHYYCHLHLAWQGAGTYPTK